MPSKVPASPQWGETHLYEIKSGLDEAPNTSPGIPVFSKLQRMGSVCASKARAPEKPLLLGATSPIQGWKRGAKRKWHNAFFVMSISIANKNSH